MNSEMPMTDISIKISKPKNFMIAIAIHILFLY